MMNEKNKMDCDDLLKTHKMTQKFVASDAADAAMLATVVNMARRGDDDMALYMLHNLKPWALDGTGPEPEESDIDDLLKAILS